MEDFKELEYKYNAESVKLTDFQDLAESLAPIKKIDASSWDIYYTDSKHEERFVRYRESDTPELTIKRKTKSTNNWERVEVDLPLNPDKITERIVETFVSLEGYKKNFKIYKSCFIYWFDNTNMVYYTVYNENMKEIGRYLEVEVNKEKLKELPVEELKKELGNLEVELEKLGITRKNRMKRSLFEICKN